MSQVKKLSFSALMLGCALALSYIEAILPMPSFLPGFKLGLSNIAVMLTVFCAGPLSGAAVLIAKISVSALLFGTPISFAISLLGGIFAFAAYFLFLRFGGKKISFIGVSEIAAVLHNLGQLAAVCVIFGAAALSYLPLLLIFGVLSGTLTGIVANLSVKGLCASGIILAADCGKTLDERTSKK